MLSPKSYYFSHLQPWKPQLIWFGKSWQSHNIPNSIRKRSRCSNHKIRICLKRRSRLQGFPFRLVCIGSGMQLYCLKIGLFKLKQLIFEVPVLRLWFDYMIFCDFFSQFGFAKWVQKKFKNMSLRLNLLGLLELKIMVKYILNTVCLIHMS